MLKRLLVLIILTLFSNSAKAGELETALENKDKIFFYLTSQKCGYCIKFDPIFSKLKNKYNNKCKFIKLDVGTNEGYIASKRFDVNYVPYVLIINGRTKEGNTIPFNCIQNYACVDKVVENFLVD